MGPSSRLKRSHFLEPLKKQTGCGAGTRTKGFVGGEGLVSETRIPGGIDVDGNDLGRSPRGRQGGTFAGIGEGLWESSWEMEGRDL